MKKSLLFLLAFTVLCSVFSCKGGTSSVTDQVAESKTSVTSVEVLNMKLLVGKEVPVAVNNQNGVNITNDVEINAVDPSKASTSSNGLITAKKTGAIDFIVSAGNFEQTVTLTAVEANSTLEGISIGAIQSPAHVTPYDDMSFSNLQGIVTQKSYLGFYIQSLEADNFLSTSEGIFVYSYGASVTPGDIVTLEGSIYEYVVSYNTSTTSLSTTQLKVDKTTIQIDSSGNTIPGGVSLSDRIPPNSVLSSGGNLNSYTHVFDCENEGLDFWESLEGMLVTVEKPIVISPYAYGDFYVIADNGSNSAGLFNNRGGIMISETKPHPEKIAINVAYDKGVSKGSTWGVNVGDSFTGSITAPLSFDAYLKAPILDAQYADKSDFWASKVEGNLTRETTSIENGNNKLTIASFNIENFNSVESAGDKVADLAETIVTGLGSPDIIAIAEMQDDNGDEDCTNGNDGTVTSEANAQLLVGAIESADASTSYSYTDIAPVNNQDGGAPGGNIRVGFLYNNERVRLVNNANGAGDSTTSVAITNNNGAIALNHNPVRIIDDAFDNSRKPLLAEFSFKDSTGSSVGESFYVINVHFSSKRGDDPAWGYNQPPDLSSEDNRTPQCQAVNNIVDQLLAVNSDAKIIVLGDFNDFVWSTPVKTLMGNVLESLVESKLNQNEHYSYIYMGNSQELDHITATSNLIENAEVDIVHRYCEFWDQQTDHDPTVASFVIE